MSKNKELTEFVNSYKNLDSKPNVHLATSPKNWSAVDQASIVNGPVKATLEMAPILDCNLIDVQAKTLDIPRAFHAPDGCHLSDIGYVMLAHTMLEGMKLKNVEITYNKSTLYDLYNKVKDVKESDCTPSIWSKFNSARNRVKQLLDDKQAMQSDILVAVRELEEISASLSGLPQLAQKGILWQTIDDASKLDLSKYTEESAEAVRYAIEQAKIVISNDKLTIADQSVVETATSNLKIAVAALEFDEEPEVVDKSLLRQAIEEASKLNKSEYTEKSWKPFEDALIVAKDVLNNELATQVEVTEAMNALLVAKNELKEDTTLIKDILKSAIDKANIAKLLGQLDKLAPVVKELIITTSDTAQSVYANLNATNAECLSAWMNLAESLQYLDFKSDKAALLELITVCNSINKEDYKEGLEAFEEALKAAQKVYDDSYTLQASVDKAYHDLENAKNSLVRNDAPNKLQLELIINAIHNNVGNGSMYKQDENYEMLKKALEEASRVLEDVDATQFEINTALLALTDAYENIRLLPSEEQLGQLHGYVNVVQSINRNLYSQEQLNEIDKLFTQATALLLDFDDKIFSDIEKDLAISLKLINDKEYKIPHSSAPSSKDTSDSVSPNTGDTTNLLAIIFLLLLSGFVLVKLQKKCNKRYKIKINE